MGTMQQKKSSMEMRRWNVFSMFWEDVLCMASVYPLYPTSPFLDMIE